MRDWGAGDTRTARQRLASLVVFETDDWVEACQRALPENWETHGELHVEGTHPSHIWDDEHPKRCKNCGGWANGSYGGVAPCGYIFRGSLSEAIADELRMREHPDASNNAHVMHVEEPQHMKLNSRQTLCKLDLADRCWTNNPNNVTCEECYSLIRKEMSRLHARA